MKKNALTVILLGALALLVTALTPPGGARAQPQPTLVISPASGPCDGMIQISGSGFPMPSGPYPSVTLHLLQPGSADLSMGVVTYSYVRGDGTLGEWVGLLDGCQAAAFDSQAGQPTGHLIVAATASYSFQGQRVPDIIATAEYAYTTTAPPSQPTLMLWPTSGPCVSPVEVMGTGFPVTPGQGIHREVYLIQPGTTDVSMGFLTLGNVNQDGSFSQWFSLYEHGCEAAALDSQAEQPAGYLTIVAAPQHLTPGPGLQPGERIPNIIAVAHYRYTTTTPPPPPVMVISPSSGPCDATVEVTGTGFQPGEHISLGWAYPGSESPEGDLASVQADAEGAFLAEVALGEIGCHAAQAYPSTRDPLPPRLLIDALPVGPPQGVGGGVAEALYTLTTTAVGAGGAPRVLPSAGGGPTEGSGPVSWAPLIGGVAAIGVILVAGMLFWRRVRS